MAFNKTCHYCLTFHADFLRASSHVYSCSKEQLTFTGVLFIYISAKYRLVIQGRRSISGRQLSCIQCCNQVPNRASSYTCILQKYFHLTLSLLISSQISHLLTWNLEKRLLSRFSDHVPIRRAFVYIYCLIYIQS